MKTRQLFYFVIATVFFTIVAGAQTNADPINEEDKGLTFLENKGQISDQHGNVRPDVLFSGVSQDLVFHLRRSGISYQLTRIDKWKATPKGKGKSREEKLPEEITNYRLDLEWPGANAQARVRKGNTLHGYNNYYFDHCPQGALQVQEYETVTYEQIYKGIDLHYYSSNGVLKYDYRVMPFANYHQIKICVKGAQEISYLPNGGIALRTPLGTVEEAAPMVFQEGKQLTARWVVLGDTLSFEVEKYDATKPMVIDPVVRLWGSYFGHSYVYFGHRRTWAYDCATFGGDMYMSGRTVDGMNSLIATAGSFQNALLQPFSGGAFLVKFSTLGVRLWGTFYGYSTISYDCCTDKWGNVYIVGECGSLYNANLATPNSHQPTIGSVGNGDAFLAKFDANGTRLWGTFYGGAGNETGWGCCTDTTGNVYLCGMTQGQISVTGIATQGAHQTASAGIDAFLVKFNTNGLRLWGTYYGGAPDMYGEWGYACCTDKLNNVYMGGVTDTYTYMATANAHQTGLSGSQDGFLVKFDSTGTRQWGTYYGDMLYDAVYGCATDPDNNVVITGWTFGTAFSGTVIASANGFQASPGGNYDGYLAKFNSNGTRLWGTYYGGQAGDEGTDCAIDTAGVIYMVGGTGSTASISTVGSHQSTYGGGVVASDGDGYIAAFDTSGARLWGSYYGGTMGDEIEGVCTDMNGAIYISGVTCSTNTPSMATPGTYQSTNSYSVEISFAARFSKCFAPPTPVNVTPAASQLVCTGMPAIASVGGEGVINWYATPTSTVSLAEGPQYAWPNSSGVYTVYAEASMCGTLSPARTPITVTISSSIAPTITVNSGSICTNSSFSITPGGAQTYSYLAGTYTATGGSVVVTPNVSTYFLVTGTGTNGCAAVPAISNVTVLPGPDILVTSGTICAGQSFSIQTFSQWFPGASSFSIQGGSALVTPTANSTYTVVGYDANGCVTPQPVISTVSVSVRPVISVNSGSICAGQIFVMQPTGAQSYSYAGGSPSVAPQTNSSYTVRGYNSFGCVSVATATAFVSVSPAPTVAASGGSICAGQLFTINPLGANTYTVSGGSAIVSPATSSVYMVNGTDLYGCVNLIPVPVSVTVYSLPIISATGGSICAGGTLSLTASGANTYTYIPSGPIVSAVANTQFSISGTDNSGCESLLPAIVNLTVNTLPTVSANSGSICNGASFTLNAAGAISYSYSSGSSVVTPTASTVYTITGLNTAGCTNSVTTPVFVFGLPAVAVTGNTAICLGDQTVLTASGANSYTWNPGGVTNSVLISPTVSSVYSLSGTNSNGCTGSINVQLIVNTLPLVSIAANTAICAGETTTLTAGGASFYLWQTLETTSVVMASPITGTVYSVTGTDSNGCAQTASITLMVNPLPVISITPSQTLLCIGENLMLLANGGNSYEWQMGEITTNVLISPTITGSYSVIGTDANGCSASATQQWVVSECTAIPEQNGKMRVRVYPNPTDGYLFVELNKAGRAQFYNALGQVVLTREVTAGENTFELFCLPNGIYFLDLSSVDGGQIKIVKE